MFELYLLLKSKDVSNTAINRVPEPRLSLITNGDHGVEALLWRDVKEELRHIAGSKHLMHRREMSRALFRVEIRREYASSHTLPPQELACPAWPATTSATPATPAASSATTGRATASHVSSTHNLIHNLNSCSLKARTE